MKSNCVIISAFIMLLASFSYAKAQTENNTLEDKILIVVHAQEGYGEGELSKDSTADELVKINQLIELMNPDQIAYSKAMFKILNLSFKRIGVDKVVEEFDDRLNLINENIFIDEGDIFESEGMIQYLDKKKIKKIVVVGRVAEGCITESVLSGKKLGYDMYIIPEAIIGKSDESKMKAINKLKAKGAKELLID